MAFQS